MYQSQIAGLKQSIINSGGFEDCKIENSNFNGIQILGVRKLPNSINQGRHHLFVDLEDYRGLEFSCLLNKSLFYPFNKPTNEVGCHIDFYGQNNSLQIFGIGGKYSQIISGLSFDHTVYGHSSYYIYAVKTNAQVEQPTIENKALNLIGEIEALLKKLKEII